ncbi:MAG: hypothetical protein ACOCWR_08230 [Oceanidesulfovibrio sp.]
MAGLEPPYRISFLGQFLMRKGLVNEEQLLEAVGYQKGVNELIGDLAVRREYLAPNDVEAILRSQRESELPFGQIAVEQGRLTEAQRESLVQAQAMGYVFLGEALLANGFLTALEFVEAINEFSRVERALAACNRDVLHSTEHQDLFLKVVDSFRDALSQLAGTPVKMGRAHLPLAAGGVFQQSMGEAGILFRVSLLGGLAMRFWALFPGELAERLMGSAPPEPGPAGSWAGVTKTAAAIRPLEEGETWTGLARTFVLFLRSRLGEEKYGDFSAVAQWVDAEGERAAMEGALTVDMDCPEGRFHAAFLIEEADMAPSGGVGDSAYEHEQSS